MKNYKEDIKKIKDLCDILMDYEDQCISKCKSLGKTPAVIEVILLQDTICTKLRRIICKLVEKSGIDETEIKQANY